MFLVTKKEEVSGGPSGSDGFDIKGYHLRISRALQQCTEVYRMAVQKYAEVPEVQDMEGPANSELTKKIENLEMKVTCKLAPSS